jgi:transcription-repair coupling factor (superfamily II helicase)
LTREAAARLATLSDHTELGSGFAIAMRDLEIRGAGNLLGDEQSGHVAAVGFELYCSLLDEATEALRAGEGDGRPAAPEATVRLDVDVDAYVPAEYVPFEAAKIDVHRRIAAARQPSELRELRDELRDRFGPAPEPVEALLELQRARIELGRAGARTVEVRGRRLAAAPVELEAAQADELRERLPEADYEWRAKTVSVRVPDEPGPRLAALLALAEALSAARAVPSAA